MQIREEGSGVNEQVHEQGAETLTTPLRSCTLFHIKRYLLCTTDTTKYEARLLLISCSGTFASQLLMVFFHVESSQFRHSFIRMSDFLNIGLQILCEILVRTLQSCALLKAPEGRLLAK